MPKSFPKTPAHVAATATETGVLQNRNRLTLLGIMGATKAPRALMMTPNGQTRTYKLGQNTPSGKLVAIGKTHVVLQGFGKTTELHIPG